MRKQTQASYVERIGRVLKQVADNVDAPLPLAALAETAALSPFHFHRVYRGIAGETVQETLRRVRMMRAGYALRSGGRSVTEIALEAGYESPEGFARAFKQGFELSPSQYRKSRAATPFRPTNINIHFRPETGEIRLIADRKEHGMKVEIKEVEAQPMLALRHLGPYHEVGRAFSELKGWLGKQGLDDMVIGSYGISYDDPESVAAADLRYDACAALRAGAELPEGSLPDGMRFDTLSSGRYACALLEGSYTGMQDTFHRLFGHWLPESGEEPDARPCMEWYLNDPMEVSEHELRTLICIPVKG
ncbi:AraC family transcriptional regulator [Nisaea acidiphila]|uniref:AraC family transcriptional regulator n=1 Tax=Nisaea acidiphila TaxID=1862145 RepID=A0A9J7AU28_9PROT|nr:AraC family transcriptional regulator [Nisaea acidiphila]UUX50606.1 AraC family transcriptional regulator [Nisaea acidiphila]